METLPLIWLTLLCALWAIMITATATPLWADAFAFSFSKKKRCESGCWNSRYKHNSFALYETSESLSKSGEFSDSVVQAIDELFPKQGLEQRIALSRKDGYWPFIKAGEDPPQELVYGEFDVLLLQKSLERSRVLLRKDDKDVVFCDLGSGTGRLVLATAALYPMWKLCRGIELLESIHEEALKIMQSCRRERHVIEEDVFDAINNANSNTTDDDAESGEKYDDEKHESNITTKVTDEGVGSDTDSHDDTTYKTEFSLASNDGPLLPLAPIELECGSFTDPYGSFCDANILFCFSSAMPNHILVDLARSIGRQSLPGTIVITTEYKLPLGGSLDPLPDDPEYPCGEYELELLETISGDCTAVGGESTVFIHRVVKSVGTGKRRVRPVLPPSELAYRAIKHMEEIDTQIFLNQVSNQMAFLGFPDSWRPNI